MTKIISPYLLKVEKLSISFKDILALDDVSMDVAESEIVGVIGPNGAGKTTLFNCLSCLYRQFKGHIIFNQQTIDFLRPHQIARIGINRTFQNDGLFPDLNVIDNILVGAHSRGNAGIFKYAFLFSETKAWENQIRQEAEMISEFLGIQNHWKYKVREVPIGIQKKVGIARALMSQPKLLLLDEPASGLSSNEILEMSDLIVKLRERFKLTILVVEHHMQLIMAISDRIMVLNFGKKIAEGLPKEIQKHPEVIKAYLGQQLGNERSDRSLGQRE